MPCGFFSSKSSESMTISQDQTSPRPAIFIKVTGGPAARSAWLMLTDALWYTRTLPVLLPWDPQCHHHQCQTSWRFLISPCPWQRWPERFTRFFMILQSSDDNFETQCKHGSWHHGCIGSVVKQKGWPRTLAWSHHWRTWHVVQSFLKHAEPWPFFLWLQPQNRWWVFIDNAIRHTWSQISYWTSKWILFKYFSQEKHDRKARSSQQIRSWPPSDWEIWWPAHCVNCHDFIEALRCKNAGIKPQCHRWYPQRSMLPLPEIYNGSSWSMQQDGKIYALQV